ncbi:hypothetical protein Aave_4636 [Paracidovorax citrulli AAC00-1]|uniref:Uncharacterized protein n=1 Tax=Paracidovorax citrulli (strain AAC00-1) TaxID=397945 RepID=A1TW33_PARC0|nr:hypothetical protein Aave_4636 [Paracidovorax citrulli AAC00-1]
MRNLRRCPRASVRHRHGALLVHAGHGAHVAALAADFGDVLGAAAQALVFGEAFLIDGIAGKGAFTHLELVQAGAAPQVGIGDHFGTGQRLLAVLRRHGCRAGPLFLRHGGRGGCGGACEGDGGDGDEMLAILGDESFLRQGGNNVQRAGLRSVWREVCAPSRLLLVRKRTDSCRSVSDRPVLHRVPRRGKTDGFALGHGGRPAPGDVRVCAKAHGFGQKMVETAVQPPFCAATGEGAFRPRDRRGARPAAAASRGNGPAQATACARPDGRASSPAGC